MIGLPAMNLVLLLLLQLPTPPEPPQAALKPVDFQRQIRPLLAKNCLACHGGDPSTREAELRLDLRAEAIRWRDDFAVIVPGDAQASEMIFRVSDTLDPMPPEKTGHHLTAEQIELLARWIDEGAEYRPHWAFVKPQSSAQGLPALHPIDRFVSARLEPAGLQPAPSANRETLLRRLSLDLIGLPPTLEERLAFLQDTRTDAYPRLVDRLLARPQFGERWASVWLDLARYADSKGHGSDPLRVIWRYRDWVIDAFNRDLPFDQFTRLQMAGDLIENATTETRLATAFHRNSLVNTEGGTDDEEFRVAAVKDRTNLTMQVWMGLTFGCAECHTHKFDPITHQDYYQAFALFNQTADSDKNDDSPKISTPTSSQQRQLKAWQTQLAKLQLEIERQPIDAAEFLNWQHQTLAAQVQWRAWGLRKLTSAQDQLTLKLEVGVDKPTAIRLELLADPLLPGAGPGASPGNGNLVIQEAFLHWSPQNDAARKGQFIRLTLPGQQRILSLAEVEVFADTHNFAETGLASQSSLAYQGAPERAIDGNTDGDFFRSNSVTHNQTENNPWWELDLGQTQTIEAVRIWNRTDGNLQSRLNGLQIEIFDSNRSLVASHWLPTAPLEMIEWKPAAGGDIRIHTATSDFSQTGWSAAMASDGDLSTGWAIGPQQGRDHQIRFDFHLPSEPGTLALELVQNFGDGHVLGKFRTTWTNRNPLPAVLPPRILQALNQKPSLRSAEVTATLVSHYRSSDPGVLQLQGQRHSLEAQIEGLDIPQTPVLVALPADQQRQTYVLEKGNFLNPLQEVQADVPAAFHWTEDAVTDRLELADWLTHPDNPLTARVQANRIWARLFGRGLVSTEEDFGAQGALPSHPELLDWLALEYAGHWSLKRLLKTIVTSETYRQSSITTSEKLALDPANILLSRGPRFRLPAEMVRDQALRVSGLLSDKIGGPSVFPPQPEGLWQAAFNGQRDWRTSTGIDRWRRGLYTFMRRSTPYPSMVVFDAPSREICTLRRVRTNTPLQAFVTLNDPAFVECAQALGRRILQKAAASSVEQLAYGYLLCMGHAAPSADLAVLKKLFQEQLQHYQLHPDEATQLASDPLGPLPPNADSAQYAAMTVVANVLLNLDGFLNKD
jgi:Protein of unknown function (DUF1553)/Protein of unknown function (DUF1549)/NedA-like, galactose-binding domain/Planctomycete cytochrome C